MEQTEQNNPIEFEKKRFIADMLDGIYSTYNWRPLTMTEMKLVVQNYLRVLDRMKVPFESYQQLYDRMMEDRLSISLRNPGTDPPKITPELLARTWSKMQDELNAGKEPPPDPAANCDRCRGTGMEIIRDKGARICRHQPLTEQEKEMERDRLEQSRSRHPEIFRALEQILGSRTTSSDKSAQIASLMQTRSMKSAS